MEWGRTPRLEEEAIWNFLTAPLSRLCAFWWPPSACELKNFLMQKLQEKIFDPGRTATTRVAIVSPRLRFSSSWLQGKLMVADGKIYIYMIDGEVGR
jgi:hypothetical protein